MRHAFAASLAVLVLTSTVAARPLVTSRPLETPSGEHQPSPDRVAAPSVTHQPVMRTMPDVVGQPQAQAEQALREAGLTVTVQTQSYSEGAAGGLVASERPAAGEQLPVGSSAAIV